MDDPYKVLGIREGASEAEIKAAYREQVKKYHPDQHQENPLYDLAEEKLREVNEAYDYLMGNGASGSGRAGGRNAQRQQPVFREVRKAIDRGDLAAAEQMLARATNRDAEWHFLSGVLALRKGWYDEAIGSIQMAVSMDPNNPEYIAAMNNVTQTAGGFRTEAYGRGYRNNNDELCRMCQCLICMDCLTDCC